MKMKNLAVAIPLFFACVFQSAQADVSNIIKDVIENTTKEVIKRPPPGPWTPDEDGCYYDRGKKHCYEEGHYLRRGAFNPFKEKESIRPLSYYQKNFCDANKGRMNHSVRDYQDAVKHPAAYDKRFGIVVVGCETFDYAIEFVIDNDPKEIVFDKAVLSGQALNKRPVVVFFKSDIERKDDFMIRLKKKCEENDVLFVQSNIL